MVLLAVAACSAASAEVALVANKALWDREGPDSYSFQVQISCFCMVSVTSPIEIVVLDSRVSEIGYAKSDGGDYRIVPDEVKAHPFVGSVPEIFEGLSKLLREHPASISVEWDERYGFPTSVSVDMVRGVIDDEFQVRLFDFEVSGGDA